MGVYKNDWWKCKDDKQSLKLLCLVIYKIRMYYWNYVDVINYIKDLWLVVMYSEIVEGKCKYK